MTIDRVAMKEFAAIDPISRLEIVVVVGATDVLASTRDRLHRLYFMGPPFGFQTGEYDRGPLQSVDLRHAIDDQVGYLPLTARGPLRANDCC